MGNLFSTDTVTKIIIAVLGFVFAEFLSYWKSRKGRWILVEKITEDQLFTKPPTMTGEHSIDINAGGVSIQSLVQTHLRISNTGADIAEPVDIYLQFKNRDSNNPEIVFGIKAKRPNNYVIWLPPNILEIHRIFFNSSRAYENAINLLIYTEHHLTVKVEGSGKGWQSKYLDRTQRKSRFLNVSIGKSKSVIEETLEWYGAG